jgi:hypothetical protein
LQTGRNDRFPRRRLTTQQAALLTVRALERAALAEVAVALTTTHQNVKQIAGSTNVTAYRLQNGTTFDPHWH